MLRAVVGGRGRGGSRREYLYERFLVLYDGGGGFAGLTSFIGFGAPGITAFGMAKRAGEGLEALDTSFHVSMRC